jgi:hypothetical protein
MRDYDKRGWGSGESSGEEAEADPRRQMMMLRKLQRRAAQRRSCSESDPGGAVERAARSGGGASVDKGMRSRAEAVTGADLGSVRIHIGEASQQAAESVSALAYTVGHDIHFGAGQYQPGTTEGDKLIAHELAHAAQQGPSGSASQAKLEVSQEGDPAEVEADAVAARIVDGGEAMPAHAHGPSLLRQAKVAEPETDADKGFHAGADFSTHQQLAANAFTELVGNRIDAIDDLIPEIEKKDEPSWTENLVKAAFEIALTAASAGLGEYLAVAFIKRATVQKLEEVLASTKTDEKHKLIETYVKQQVITKEVLKNVFKETAKKVAPGAANLGLAETKKAKDARQFMSGLKVAVRNLNHMQSDAFQIGLNVAAQTSHVGDAPVWKAVFSVMKESLDAAQATAKQQQHDKARDAWLTYLAQNSRGVKIDDKGSAGTDMSEAIDVTNAKKTFIDGQFDRGVLHVYAYLPFMIDTEERRWWPRIKAAYLFGVNDVLRDQLAEKNLDEIHSPFVLHCDHYGRDNFDIKSDENGTLLGLEDPKARRALRSIPADWLFTSLGKIGRIRGAMI